MPSPSVESRILTAPRSGRAAAEAEDAAGAWTDAWPVRAAVADGATESAYAGQWARMLVEGVGRDGIVTADAFAAALPDWQARWRAETAEDARDRPWYVAAKASEGAFATVLGVSIRADGHWQALAVGDCCLFHVRNGTCRRSWPLSAPDAFTNRPALVPSAAQRSVPDPQTASGTWQAGDAFLLATDAVAAWLLRRGPATGLALTPDAFDDTVEAARDDGTLRNDDATLLVVELLEAPDVGDA
jgi:hypothetical protein